jgi:hypothetical protein
MPYAYFHSTRPRASKLGGVGPCREIPVAPQPPSPVLADELRAWVVYSYYVEKLRLAEVEEA